MHQNKYVPTLVFYFLFSIPYHTHFLPINKNVILFLLFYYLLDNLEYAHPKNQ
jgi:hypothetical protein